MWESSRNYTYSNEGESKWTYRTTFTGESLDPATSRRMTTSHVILRAVAESRKHDIATKQSTP